MARKLSISAIAPYLALLACVWSVLHPSRDIRLVRSLRADVDAVRADNATLRQEVAGVVQFVRDELPSLVPRLEAAPGGVLRRMARHPRPSPSLGSVHGFSRCTWFLRWLRLVARW